MAGMDVGASGGAPPLPPTAMPAGGGASGGGPTFQGLNPQGQQQAPPGQASAGASQIGGALTRLAMEIDQALKLLAQAAPSLAGWVDQTTQQLRQQVGMALQSGVPTSATPDSNRSFPGGGSNL